MRRLKFGTKLLLSISLILVFTALIISMLSYQVTSSALVDNLMVYSDEYLAQLGRNLENAQEGLNDNIFDGILKADLLDRRNLERYLASESTVDEMAFLRKGNMILASDQSIRALALATTDGLEYFLAEHKEMVDEKVLMNTLKENRSNRSVLRRFSDTQLVVVRPLYDLTDTSLLGHIALVVDQKYLLDEFRYSSKYQEWHILVLDNDHDVLVYEDSLSMTIFQKVEHQVDHKGKVQFTFEMEGKSYIANVLTSPKKDFRVMNIIPYDSVTGASLMLMRWIMLIGVGAMLINILIALLISRGFSRNIRLLVERIRGFKAGDFTTKIELNSKDEIGQIADEFNEMAAEINTLVNKVYHEQLISEKAKKEALRFEYDALQAKMNPHFLYNILESVNSMAKMEGNQDISEVVCLLGELLRESIGDERENVYLEDELDYVDRYIRLKKLTRKYPIKVTYDIDEILLGAFVPKFILQPIVENAFVHGIKNSDVEGHLTIGSGLVDGMLNLWVRDNGPGFAPNSTRSEERDIDDWQRTRIGLKSIDKRLKILYGDHTGVKIRRLDKETEVRLIMVYRTEV